MMPTFLEQNGIITLVMSKKFLNGKRRIERKNIDKILIFCMSWIKCNNLNTKLKKMSKNIDNVNLIKCIII